MSRTRPCPQCGAPLPEGGGPCPRCLLAVGLEASDGPAVLGEIPAPGTAVRYVGDYELLEVIAQGGMGVVYKARQRSLRRMVALKMHAGGHHSSEGFRRRFRREAAMAARLQHPNIVPVYEVGEHEGLPYFSMEYVPGPNLAGLTRDQPLPPRRAAELVRTVAEAVHYAHGHGVLHRDLKPSNILLGEDERPRVTDFGLARVMDEESELTGTGDTLGTPSYLPPEQASGKWGEVSTHSDVYSLGAVLYHLVTGRPPFLAGTVAETLEQVGSVDPVPPRTLNPAVPQDLETICLKCLEKEPSRRYRTAREMAEDLDRWLRGEPILARPVTRWERLGKWCRREPRLAWSILGIIVALLLGTVVSSWLALRYSREAVRSRQAEELAKERLTEAQTVSEFLAQAFESPDPGRDGRTVTVVETLAKAVKKLETDLASQPSVQARLRRTLGSTYIGLGLYREALDLYQQAREYYLNEVGLEHPDTIEALTGVAEAYRRTGRLAESVELNEQMLTVSRNALGPEHVLTLSLMNNLANSYESDRRPNEALVLREKVVVLDRKVRGAEDPATIVATFNLSVTYQNLGRYADALRLREEVVPLSRKVNGAEHPVTIVAIGYLADSYARAHRESEALALREELLPLNQKVNGPEHPLTIAAMSRLADSYAKGNRLTEALELREHVLNLSRQVSGPGASPTITAMQKLAESYARSGRKAEALDLREQVLQLYRAQLGAGDHQTIWAMIALAGSYSDAGRPGDVEALMRGGITNLVSQGTDKHKQLADLYVRLGDAMRSQNKADEAETAYRKGLESYQAAKQSSLELEQWLASGLALVLRGRGEFAEAEMLYRKALENSSKIWPAQPEKWLWQLNNLVDLLLIQGKPAEAEDIVERVLHSNDRQGAGRTAALRVRASVFARQGKWREAEADLTTVIDLEPSEGLDYLQLAAVLAETGELARYDALCDRVLARVAATSENPGILDQAAAAFLLLPASGNRLEQATRMANQALSSGETSPWLPFFRLRHGLALYRQGRYADSVEETVTLAASHRTNDRSSPEWALQVATSCVTAMALQRLHQAEKSKAALRKAREITVEHFPKVGKDDLGQRWHDWLVARILLREATALWEKGTVP